MKQENLLKIVEIFLDEDRFSLEIWNQKEELIFFNTKSKDLCSSLGIDLNHEIKFTEYLQKHNLDYSDFINFKEKDLNWYPEIEVDSRILSISFKFYSNQFIIIYKEDITEIKKEEKIKEILYESIDNLPSEMSIWDESEKLIFSNKFAQKVYEQFGFSFEKGISYDSFLDFLIENKLYKNRTTTPNEWSYVGKVNKNYVINMMRNSRRNNEKHSMQLTRIDQKQILLEETRLDHGGLVSSSTDISELVKQEEQLKLAVHNLKIAQEESQNYNNLIKESISAASYIQQAILPELSTIEENLLSFDCVWEPRDKVGGDFYWFGNKNNYSYIIIADCVGHGVPGALMTMIVSAVIDRIFSFSDNLTTDHILAKLDQMLLSHLKINSQNPKTNLGLDAGVICFSKERNILWYSGAKINLYQNKDSQIIEYKGDKKSIGYRFEKDPKKFKSYEINLSEENSFLIFSDGVTDQIGGSQRMMFGKKRVFDSFLSCNDSHKPAAHIYSDMQAFQGRNTRRDDVLIFSFSV